MILGIGTDIANISRIEQCLTRHGTRFENRLFTKAELGFAKSRRHRAATLAKRFAAKEACAKALGTGFTKGVAFRDIGVQTDKAGKPSLVLKGGAAKRLKALTPKGYDAVLHLSLSDDAGMAAAFVVIEATEKP
jgi:holo-[acyl-carrier protein] synthase